MRASGVRVTIDLGRIARNVDEIRARCNTSVIGVLKADAYGLGAKRVAAAISDKVDAFYTFDLNEASEISGLGRETIVLRVDPSARSGDLQSMHVRPVVTDLAAAIRWRDARPVLCVDTGQQRFACPPERLAEILHAGICREAMTHASSLDQVDRFLKLVGGAGLRLHAAGTLLLDAPHARLHAVRPGLAMYTGAVRVSCPLVEIRESSGPAGYTGFSVPRFGVILCGYSNGLRPGACVINGRRQKVLEVGMQSAFVEVDPTDQLHDLAILLGEGLNESTVAAQWGTTAQEVLVRLAGVGVREYLD